jgi:activator of HSP90 ATPase
MAIEFVVSTMLPATPEEVYDTWMSSEGHSAMTGSPAKISDQVGGEFEAWDGYIHGKNINLERGMLIVQSWRTSDFSDTEDDSLIEINLKPVGDQTELTLRHSNLPDHGMQYKDGWVESYFEPMKEYFSNNRASAAA